jgi:hypothetical protein
MLRFPLLFGPMRTVSGLVSISVDLCNLKF